MPEVDDGKIAGEVLDGLLAGTTPEEEAETTSTETVEAATVQEETEAAAETTEDEEAGKVASEDSPVKSFIAKKYGGDEAKFMEGLWNLMNAGSKQHKELQELKALVSNLAAAPEEQEEDENIGWLKEQLGQADKEVSGYTQRQYQLLEDISSKKLELAEKKGEVKRADDYEKGVLRQEISALESDISRLEDRWQSYEDRKNAVFEKKQEFNYRLKQAHKDSETTKVARESEAAEWNVYRDNFLSQFQSAVDDAVKEAGYSESSSLREHFYNTVRNEGLVFLQANPTGSIDPKKFVAERAKVYFDVLGVAKKTNFAKVSAGNTELTTKIVPKPATQPTKRPTLPTGKMTAAEARAFARKILG